MADDEPTADAYRIEHDTMGEVRVPAAARWAAQTQRAVENFPVSGRPLPPRLIHALGAIKAAAAEENARLGVLDADVAGAIAAAASEVAAGEWDAEFPVDVFQTGSGTSSNMNANEVIASLASERLGREVHPNDHVNASQSSNDVFPSAIHVAAAVSVSDDLLPALDRLGGALRAKAAEVADVVKAGRTHLMDATPVTLGQELDGYAAQVEQAADRLRAALPRVGELPLGGTATGTGLNAPEGFAAGVVAALVLRLGVVLSEAPDHFAAQGARDHLVSLSGELRALAAGLLKVANDLRWMASGPRTGLAEIRLPDLQPGSSIMPGKVNPVIPEVVSQVVVQVYGNDAAVAFGGSQGNFELNVFLPVIARNLLESVALLAAASRLLADRCVDGIEADRDRCRAYAEATPQAATALNPVLGYERVAELVKESARTGRSIREVVLDAGLLDEAALDDALDLLDLTRGGRHTG
ncbi:MAG: class II fumarate hydratase [Acidimicrobiales bacterium]|nr:class II fumarate hydratase [Acidimicrobiales bacterium]